MLSPGTCCKLVLYHPPASCSHHPDRRWQDPFGHSAATPSMWQQMGMQAFGFWRVHYATAAELQRTKSMEFVWRSSASKGPENGGFSLAFLHVCRCQFVRDLIFVVLRACPSSSCLLPLSVYLSIYLSVSIFLSVCLRVSQLRLSSVCLCVSSRLSRGGQAHQCSAQSPAPVPETACWHSRRAEPPPLCCATCQ